MADLEVLRFLLHVKGNSVLCFLTRVLSLFFSPPDLWYGWGVPSSQCWSSGNKWNAEFFTPCWHQEKIPLTLLKRGGLGPENKPLLKMWGQKMLICLTAGWPGTAGPCLPLEALSSSPVRAPTFAWLFPPAWLAASAQPLVLNCPQTPVPRALSLTCSWFFINHCPVDLFWAHVLNTFYVLEDSDSHHRPESSQTHLFWWPSWLLRCLRAIKLNMFKIESW